MIVLLAIVGIVAAEIALTASHLWRHHRNLKWGIAFATAMVVGIICGSWGNSSLEFDVGDQMRVKGFPIPLAVYRLEAGQWVDLVHGDSVIFAAVMITNVMFAVGVCLAPVLFFSRLWTDKGSRNIHPL